MKRKITKKILLSAFVSLVSINSFYSQAMLKEIPLERQIEASSLVVEGKVVSKESFWNAAHTNIYTVNTVEVYKVFKGEPKQTVKVITKGGVVGSMAQEVSPSLELTANDVGVFTLTGHDATGEFRPYSGVQGFYKYDLNENTAVNPFNKKQGIVTALYPEILSRTKTEVSEVLEFDVSTLSSKAAKNAKVLAPESITFSSQPISAGTGSVLTINGSGYGVVKGQVGFTNANDGGASVTYALDSQILTWSDTEITVEVPSAAGTGPVTVVDASNGSLSSEQELDVSFALLNNINSGQAHLAQLYGDNNNGGFTWNQNVDFIEVDGAPEAFLRGFNTWRCDTGVNWVLGDNTTETNSGIDNINLVAFGNNLTEGYLGEATVYYDTCNNVDWVVAEVDLLFDENTDWNYSGDLFFSTDFESVVVHELGHALLLAHVIDVNNPLNYDLSQGRVTRELLESNKDAANVIVTNSTSNMVCSYQLMSLYNCQLSVEEEALDSGIDLYPNPAKNELFIKKASSVNLENVIIYDVNGRLISKHDASNTSGVQTISLSGLSKGLYFVNINSDLASITKKLIVD